MMYKSIFNIRITNFRFRISKELFFSSFFKIKLRNPNEKELKQIVDKVFTDFKEKYKDTSLKKLEKLFKYYRHNSLVEYVVKNVPQKDINLFIKFNVFYGVINLYCRENNIKKELFKFTDNNLRKCFNNFYKKIVLIDIIDKTIINKAILSFYNLENQDVDMTDYYITFEKGLLNIYNLLYYDPSFLRTKILFISHIGNFEENLINTIGLGSYKENKLIKEKFKNSIQDNLIDRFLLSSKEKAHILIFLTEVFYDSKSGRSGILNYITFFDLILTHKPNAQKFNVEDSISQQFIQKLSACICLTNEIKDSKELTDLKTELKFIYNFRSDILHGNFSKTNEDLDKFLNLPYYNELINNEYQNIRKYTALELCVLNRLNSYFKIVFKLVGEKPLFIEALK